MKVVAWSIDQLERRPEDGAVIVAHWRLKVSEDEVFAQAIGLQKFTPNPNDPNFVPFESLTEEQVVGWVKDEMGDGHVAALEAKVSSDVDDQKVPAVIPGVPWTPPVVEVPANPEVPVEQ